MPKKLESVRKESGVEERKKIAAVIAEQGLESVLVQTSADQRNLRIDINQRITRKTRRKNIDHGVQILVRSVLGLVQSQEGLVLLKNPAANQKRKQVVF